jgi:hypothetical protein
MSARRTALAIALLLAITPAPGRAQDDLNEAKIVSELVVRAFAGSRAPIR